MRLQNGNGRVMDMAAVVNRARLPSRIIEQQLTIKRRQIREGRGVRRGACVRASQGRPPAVDSTAAASFTNERRLVWMDPAGSIFVAPLCFTSMPRFASPLDIF
jgi:hypothetical protein